MAVSTYLSVITLNINGIIAPIKRHRVAKQIKNKTTKIDRSIYLSIYLSISLLGVGKQIWNQDPQEVSQSPRISEKISKITLIQGWTMGNQALWNSGGQEFSGILWRQLCFLILDEDVVLLLLSLIQESGKFIFKHSFKWNHGVSTSKW